MDSILTSVKKLLGIDESYEHFDADVIMCINAALTVLTQLGVGPEKGFVISSKTETWSDFLGDDDPRLESVRTYVFMKVKLMFDPPTSAAAIESMNRLINEFEWRLNVTVDTPEEVSSE